MENQMLKAQPDLLAEFECPICTRYMLPPIRQCQNGHCFCYVCFEKIRKCAICRAAKSTHRPNTLEKVQLCFQFPCAYADEGCHFKASSPELAVHQRTCSFAWVRCPLRFNDCPWQGEKCDLILHCKTEHSGNVFFSSKQKLMSSSFKNRADKVYYIVFYVFNSFFRCTWDLDKDTGLMRFAVYYLGKHLREDRFFFEVSYFQDDDDEKKVSVKAPCYPMEDDNERFLNGKYFMLHHELVKDFCDEDGDLNYIVNIIEKK